MKVTWLLIRREFIERVRQRSFIVATVITAVGIILIALLPQVISGFATSTETTIAIAGPDAKVAAAMADALDKAGNKATVLSMRVTTPELPASIRAKVEDGTYDAALVAYRDKSHALGFAYYPKGSNALQNASDLKDSLRDAALLADFGPKQRPEIENALNYAWDVRSLNVRYKNENDQFFSTAVVYFLLVMLYIAVIAYGAQVAQGVIEEKQNRIMEVMIGAVRPSQLLAGKIFGIGVVALLQLTINGIAAAVSAVIAGVLYGTSSQGKQAIAEASATPQSQQAMHLIITQGLPHVPWATLGYLLVFFFLGFFSYAAIYAGIGSLLSKAEEVQQYSIVFMLPIMAAYVLAIFSLAFPDLPIVVWGSMVPLVSPMLMFTRISTGDVPAWQIALSIGGSMLAIWGLTLLAGKLYRVGVLMYGKPPKPSEIWRALRART
jgi:ABC-2 type transport system permease protein